MIETTKNIAECTLGIAGITNIPPWGAGAVTPQNWVNPPAIAAPITQELITFNGSLAAKGIAPSVMKDKPKIKFEIFDCYSFSSNLSLNSVIAKAIASGGTIPPAITAAINAPLFVSVNTPIEKA